MFDLVACKFFVLKVYTVYLLAHFFLCHHASYASCSINALECIINFISLSPKNRALKANHERV